MARRECLSPVERARFDAPPVLTVHQRLILLDRRLEIALRARRHYLQRSHHARLASSAWRVEI